MTNSFKNTIVNGEFIDNDIRLSEAIRETIDEIKQMQRPAQNKTAENEKRKFLLRTMEIAELLGVSLTVEHLLPAINEIVDHIIGFNEWLYSSSKIKAQMQTKATLSRSLAILTS